MFTSILKALLSIPELVATVKELIGWFQRATEEKKDAAKNIGDLISKL
jgi:hypothetical protein